MLLLLAETPTYGYDLLERLKTFGFPRDPGGTYRILHALEHDRLIRVRTLSPRWVGTSWTSRRCACAAPGRRWADSSTAMRLSRPHRATENAELSPLSEALLRLAVG